jgi:hypothetical protein
MTLILSLCNRDQVILVSDRRLTWNTQLVDDETNKAGVLLCRNARLAFGFTGLARYDQFDTRLWLLDALFKSGPPDYSAQAIIERIRDRASQTFSEDPALRNVPPRHKRLSIMFSGYLTHHEPPLIGYAIVTNYQNFESMRDDTEAWDRFNATFWGERQPLDDAIASVQRIGSWRAMTPNDIAQLRALLESRKPEQAIAGKAVELVREMADRPAAQGTIGKQISVIYIPSNLSEPVKSGYYSKITSYEDYMADLIVALGDEHSTAFRDFKTSKLDKSGIPTAIVIPKVRGNQPCPCGGGKKYKFCHGRPPIARL